MSEGVSTCDKIFFRIGAAVFEHDLQNTRLHLSDVWNVVGGNTVFSLYARDDNLGDLGAIVDGFVRDAKVERGGSGLCRRFTAKGPCDRSGQDFSGDN